MARGSELNSFQRDAIKLAAAEISLLYSELRANDWPAATAEKVAIEAAPVIVQKRMHP
jgi:hypothetical protein